MAFHVGQKVVCVKDGPWFTDDSGVNDYGPRKGDVLVISDKIYEDGSLWLFFDEYGKGDSYWAIRFRPVVEPKTDISIFTAMLTPKKQSIPA